MKVGFSGMGNMASAIAKGLVKQNLGSITSLHAFTRSGQQDGNALHQQLTWHQSNLALAEEVDLLVLAVKPQVVPSVLEEIRSASAVPTVVSLAAGVTTKTMERLLLTDTDTPAVVRSMPNTPSAVGAGVTGLYANEHVASLVKAFTSELFSSIGEVLWLDEEEKFNGLTAMSGSGPAYFFQFTNAMIKAGMGNGLSQEEATTLAVHTARGAGLYMAESEKTPLELQKEVTSPNGTTFAATEVFREDGIDRMVLRAITAAHDRSVELGDNK